MDGWMHDWLDGWLGRRAKGRRYLWDACNIYIHLWARGVRQPPMYDHPPLTHSLDVLSVQQTAAIHLSTHSFLGLSSIHPHGA